MISESVLRPCKLLKNLDHQPNAVTFVFGNPYALKYVCDASVLLECYDDQRDHTIRCSGLAERKIPGQGTIAGFDL